MASGKDGRETGPPSRAARVNGKAAGTTNGHGANGQGPNGHDVAGHGANGHAANGHGGTRQGSSVGPAARGPATSGPPVPDETGGAGGAVEPVPGPAKRKPFRSYDAALRWLNGRTNVERLRPPRVPAEAFKLDRMRAVLGALGDPHEALRLVHVAGSKGKGSVCEMLASCLGACGYTVGITTSPHLTDVRERVRLGPDPIDQRDFTRLLARVRAASDAVSGEHGDATYFEALTALALLYFADQAVDIGVVEVGLGGRLDSTNVITPMVCGLTTIQLEHTELLGDTHAEIAAEKAGILKPGVPAITVPQRDDVLAVFRETAERAGAPLAVLGGDVDYSSRFEAAPGMGLHGRVCVSSPRVSYEHLPAPFEGEHQAENCGLALALLDQLVAQGYRAPEVEVARGLEATPRNGRVERVWDDPRIIVDGAHTGESVGAVLRAMGAHLSYDSLVVIFGCAADKNVDAMLREVGRAADKVIFTRASDSPRSADPETLRARFTELCGKMSQSEGTVKGAVNTAARAVGRGDLICVTGSFHVAGEAKGLLERRRRELGEPALTR